MRPKTRRTPAAEERLRAAGLVFDRLENVPPEAVREVNRTGFIDMRSILLPPQVIRDALRQPLLGELLITRIGYATRLSGHYIPRPEGSLDHVLHLCIHGSGWLKIQGRDWKVGPGTMFCLPAAVPHWYGADERDPWSVYWIHFAGRHAADYFRFLDVDADRPLLPLGDFEPLVTAFEEAWSAMKEVHIWENLVRASLCMQHFLRLLHDCRQRPSARAQDRAKAVAKTVAFIGAHLGAEVSLAELAALADMSVSRFTIEFRARSGCSPMEYLNRLRVQKACELLRNTDKPVRRIAGEVGFVDPYYFSRAFKKLAGCSPLAFRRGKTLTAPPATAGGIAEAACPRPRKPLL